MIKVAHFLRHPSGAYSIERLYSDIRSRLPSWIKCDVVTSRFLSRGIWRRLMDIVRAKYYQGDINHVTGDVHFLTYLLDHKKTILTIHDLVAVETSSGFKKWLLWFFWFWLPVKCSKAIVVVSDSTRAQLLKYVSCPQDKIHVIHNPVSPEFKPSPEKFNKLNPRFLQIGTTPNKNIERVATAIAEMKCTYVIIGKLSSPQRKVLGELKVKYENYSNLSREELLDQYKHCDALLFCSTYEGFGLPIVEAQAIGRPVVSSNVFSMPEVSGEGACIVDPFDIGSIRAGINLIVSNDAYRDKLIKSGYENCYRFKLEHISNQYAELYRKIAELS